LGATYETRADADPLFTRPQVAALVHSYLGSADAKQPLASPLFGRYSGMPVIRIHVGDDEVLLDDSLRYVERAVAAGVDARADVWIGMPHGFPANVGRLKAAAQALDAVGAFLSQSLQGREQKIRDRAYEIYLRRGAQPGYELEDWLQAERELTS
jgi:monoterpene epsilon-lactone hydrolase